MTQSAVVSALARSILGGEPTVDQIVERTTKTLGRPWRWLRPLARRYVETFAGQTRPRHRDVVEFLLTDKGFRHAWTKHVRSLSVSHWLAEPQPMQPVAAASWDLPAIESAGDLSNWLGISLGELDWFADLKGIERLPSRPLLKHYHYKILYKRFGAIRLIEAPKPRLKTLQRRILTEILDRIPPHPSPHGFIKGRSIKTFIAPHVGRRVVLRMDLQDFFPSLAAARIHAIFRTLGYPESVAASLGGICTNIAPRFVWNELPASIDPQQRFDARSLYCRPHLPQGAPTSPALANICAYRVDCRLSGLAKSAGAEYTRYADDLAFSGDADFERRVERFSTYAAMILHEEGFNVHHRKTRIMRQGVRQHLTGIVANQHPNVIRVDFDRLKATLTNCVRLGPESQNRDAHPNLRAHLQGRVAFVEMVNAVKGARLRAILEKIDWQ